MLIITPERCLGTRPKHVHARVDIGYNNYYVTITNMLDLGLGRELSSGTQHCGITEPRHFIGSRVVINHD